MPLKEDLELAEAKSKEINAYLDEIGDAPLTEEAKQKMGTLNQEAIELSHRVEEAQEVKAHRDANTKRLEMIADLRKPTGQPDFGNVDPREPRPESKSLGRQWTESKEYQDMIKQLAPSGQVSESMSASMIAAIGAGHNYEAKNLITGLSLTRDTGGSGMVRPDYQGVVPFLLRPLTMRDVVTVGQTGSDLVEFTQITSFDNRAAPTADGTTVPATYAQAGNGLKPQSGLTTALVKTSVKTIPHWIPITRRALADAPQMETYINNFLMQGAEIVLEDQIVIGNNVGENFQGLDNTPGITLQAYFNNGISVASSMLDTARKARTKVRVIGRAVPTAYVMHPNDWETLDLAKDSNNNFYFGGPLAMGTKMLWGLPVVESEAVLEGTFYTGDLKQAVLWDRERANIRVSDSPYDMFLRNEVAILCELRAAFGVLRPAAIVRGDFLSGPNS